MIRPLDRYGRRLRYVTKRGTNLNVQLVRIGAATIRFYEGERGRYADQLLTPLELMLGSS